MKLFLIILLISVQAFGKIEVCQRPAKIAFGLVEHYWLRTDTIVAGMGSARAYKKYIGDEMEAAFIKVFIVDHRDQPSKKCKEYTNHDEQCVNNELIIGKPLGRFTPMNQCLSFVKNVLKKCETPEYKLLKKEKREYYTLRNKQFQTKQGGLTGRERDRLEELKAKHNF
jgi:hypothetical protein